MPIDIIVSYDGTTHDDDALMLGRMLSATGAKLSLAYVRHSREYDPAREEIGEHDAMRRLEQGALWLGDESVTKHVVVNPSTSAGLADLAAAEGADLVVFGSDYRTPPGRVEPGGSAQGLLDNGAVAIAVAAAGLRVDAEASDHHRLGGRRGGWRRRPDRPVDRRRAGRRAHRGRPRRRPDPRRLSPERRRRPGRPRRLHAGRGWTPLAAQ